MENNMQNGNNEVLSNAQVVAEEKLELITSKINKAMDGMNYGLYEISGLLSEASKFITESKYKSLGQYAEENFGIKKARASQLKTVAERFLVKKEDENGNAYYECVLPENGRPWTVDVLYNLASKMENEEIIALVDKGEINSTMSNKAIIEFLKPKKVIEKKEEAQEQVKEAQEQVKEAQEQVKEAQEQAKEAQEQVQALEAEKDIWNSDLYEINQLANFILEVCSRHASSGVVKEIRASVEEIERLSRAE